MKSFACILVGLLAASVSASPLPREACAGKGEKAGKVTIGGIAVGGGAAAVGTGAAGAAAGGSGVTASAAGGAITRGDTTVVLKEIGGIPGNECLTFRNNGDIVDAACVNEAADRQITPSKSASGADVLLVQRGFSAGFRPDLVGVQACIGFQGAKFLAVDCNGADFKPVTLVDGVLTSGTACQSGHDDKANLTVDPTGANCVGTTSTNVTPTAP